MNTFEIVLSKGNDERHFYEEALDGAAAVKLARKEWAWEFGTKQLHPVLVSATKKKY